MNLSKKLFNKNNFLKRSHAALFLSCARHDESPVTWRTPSIPFEVRIYSNFSSPWHGKRSRGFSVGSVHSCKFLQLRVLSVRHVVCILVMHDLSLAWRQENLGKNKRWSFPEMKSSPGSDVPWACCYITLLNNIDTWALGWFKIHMFFMIIIVSISWMYSNVIWMFFFVL